MCSKRRVKEAIPRCRKDFPPSIPTTCNHVFDIYHPFRISLSVNSVISTVKEQRAGICSARSISIKNMGWENVDDKPSVLIIYDVSAPISFSTVQHLYGNTVTSLVWRLSCVFSFTKHVYLIDGHALSSSAPAALMDGLYKLHSPHLTQ